MYFYYNTFFALDVVKAIDPDCKTPDDLMSFRGLFQDYFSNVFPLFEGYQFGTMDYKSAASTISFVMVEISFKFFIIAFGTF